MENTQKNGKYKKSFIILSNVLICCNNYNEKNIEKYKKETFFKES